MSHHFSQFPSVSFRLNLFYFFQTNYYGFLTIFLCYSKIRWFFSKKCYSKFTSKNALDFCEEFLFTNHFCFLFFSVVSNWLSVEFFFTKSTEKIFKNSKKEKHNKMDFGFLFFCFWKKTENSVLNNIILFLEHRIEKKNWKIEIQK